MKRLISRISRNSQGAAAIELAFVAPALLGMLLGVFQIGMTMQSYNALRGATADVARFAAVNYQTANKLSDLQLTNYARSVATGDEYGLTPSRIAVSVIDAPNQRISGATEKTITYSYLSPTVLSVLGLPDFTITYSRPVFLLS
jgi:Flp pilus assembly protein TadG